MMNADKIKVTPEWSRSKDKIWAERFESLGEESFRPAVLSKRKKMMFLGAMAATVAIILIWPAVAFLYIKEIASPRGEHASLSLPCGTRVELNAESSVKYKPLWWRFSREVSMTGEAYFEVEEGSAFTVTSPQGNVTVLGTGFNVRDRQDGYRVTCLTGKVQVLAGNRSTVLNPDMSAAFEDGALVTSSIKDTRQYIGWISGEFSFTDAPLAGVIAEIERQYNIRVLAPAGMDYLYTGRFSRDKTPAQVLEIVSKPFGITLKIE